MALMLLQRWCLARGSGVILQAYKCAQSALAYITAVVSGVAQGRSGGNYRQSAGAYADLCFQVTM